MELLNPANLLFGLLAIPLILMYFLKLRRQKAAVSSTLLWQRTLEDLRVNSPFQRMRRSILLLLQLLALLFLIFGATRLLIEGDQLVGERVIVLLDASGSMKTVERDGETRFELARTEVDGLLQGLREGRRVQLMTFDTRAKVIVPFTDDRERLRNALARLQPTDSATDPAEAIGLAVTIIEQASAAAGDIPEINIHIFSDGAFKPVTPKVLQHDKVNLSYHRVGELGYETENVGIVNFAARRMPQNPEAFVVSARLVSAAAVQRQVIAELRLDGTLIDTKRVDVAPRGETLTMAPMLFRDDRLRSGIAHLKILRDDALSIDNEAWLVLPDPRLYRVGLVTPGHYYLEQVLNSEPGLEIITGSHEDGPLIVENAASLDLIIFDQWAPETEDDLPDGNLVFLNCVPPIAGFALGNEIRQPVYMPEGDVHPILEFVNLDTVAFRKAPELTIPAWARAIASAEGPDRVTTPIMAIAERDNRRMLIVSFDAYETNWPLLVSFPVYWGNTLSWFFRGIVGAEVFGYTTSWPLSVALPNKPERAKLSGPGGMSGVADLGGDDLYHFGYPGRIGLYEVKGDGDRATAEDQQRLALNLSSAEESDNVVRSHIEFEGTTERAEGQTQSKTHMKELWQACLVIAIVFLMLEWFVFHRRPWGLT